MQDINSKNTLNYVSVMFSVISVLIFFELSVFWVFYSFYFKKLESDYIKVFKSLRLIPFTKFSDETLRNLIKKSIL
jgi:hypothetical protein